MILESYTKQCINEDGEISSWKPPSKVKQI